MDYIVREYDGTNELVDVFESKDSLIYYVKDLVRKFNMEMVRENLPDKMIHKDIRTVGECQNVLYGLGYTLELK